MADDTRRFRSKVLSVVRRIPPGRVATYGDVAAAAGNPRAARAVGNIMRDCRSVGVPAHRVIAAGGRLGGFGGNVQLKRELLRAEGIFVTGNRVKAFTTVRWKRPTPRLPVPPKRDRDLSAVAVKRDGAGLPAVAAKPRRREPASPKREARRRATRTPDGPV